MKDPGSRQSGARRRRIGGANAGRRDAKFDVSLCPRQRRKREHRVTSALGHNRTPPELCRAEPIPRKVAFYGAPYLARFHIRVGTNGPCGGGIGARTYVMSSPLMVLIVAFCSVPSKFGFVDP